MRLKLIVQWLWSCVPCSILYKLDTINHPGHMFLLWSYRLWKVIHLQRGTWILSKTKQNKENLNNNTETSLLVISETLFFCILQCRVGLTLWGNGFSLSLNVINIRYSPGTDAELASGRISKEMRSFLENLHGNNIFRVVYIEFCFWIENI